MPQGRHAPYRIVQPYGRDVGRESTSISEHATIAEAFAEIGAADHSRLQSAPLPLN
jgi:hypothetical protein